MDLRRVVALDIAAMQEGVITRDQARRAGLTDHVIAGCMADGLLVAVAPATFRVRGAPQTERMAVAAAALAADGWASHATAERLMRLGVPLGAVPLHVTVDVLAAHPRVVRLAIETGERAYFPVRVHRFRSAGEPLLTIDGVRCTDAARTLIDLARWLDVDDLEDAVERARRLGLVSTEGLARRFAEIGGRGRPGTPRVREVLARTRPNALESKLEGKAWRMLVASRIVEPVRQLRVQVATGRRHRLDFAWPDLLIAFETEGFEWHGTRARWKQDRVRTSAIERLGWRIVVGDWDDVVKRPTETLERIALALGERRALLRSA